MAVFAPVSRAAGVPRQDAALPGDSAAQSVVLQASRTREALAELEVAHRSRVETGNRLRERLKHSASTANDRALPELAARSGRLDDSLAALLSRSEALSLQVVALGDLVATRADELRARLAADPTPSEEQRLEAQAEMAELEASVAPLTERSDGFTLDLAKLNAEVEDVRRMLLGADAAPGDEPSVPGLQPAPVPDLSGVPLVELHTNQGLLTLSLRPDVAPRHVENFLKLCRSGFYDGLHFHRIIPGFVAQAGCPRGDGSGGPGYTLKNEFNELHHVRGTLSMARFGHPDSAGSQFFLCLDDWSSELDGKYTVFGRLLAGDDVLDRIAALGSESGVPLQPVVIEQVVVRPRGPGDEVQQTNENESRR